MYRQRSPQIHILQAIGAFTIIIIIRNPQNCIGNYKEPYINKGLKVDIQGTHSLVQWPAGASGLSAFEHSDFSLSPPRCENSICRTCLKTHK